MRQVGATFLSERCLEMLDNLDDEGLVLTKNGAPYANVVRLAQDEAAGHNKPHFYGALKGKLKVTGDTDAPAHSWDAGKFHERQINS